jgi:hypothetical protein
MVKSVVLPELGWRGGRGVRPKIRDDSQRAPV